MHARDAVRLTDYIVWIRDRVLAAPSQRGRSPGNIDYIAFCQGPG